MLPLCHASLISPDIQAPAAAAITPRHILRAMPAAAIAAAFDAAAMPVCHADMSSPYALPLFYFSRHYARRHCLFAFSIFLLISAAAGRQRHADDYFLRRQRFITAACRRAFCRCCYAAAQIFLLLPRARYVTASRYAAQRACAARAASDAMKCACSSAPCEARARVGAVPTSQTTDRVEGEVAYPP